MCDVCVLFLVMCGLGFDVLVLVRGWELALAFRCTSSEDVRKFGDSEYLFWFPLAARQDNEAVSTRKGVHLVAGLQLRVRSILAMRGRFVKQEGCPRCQMSGFTSGAFPCFLKCLPTQSTKDCDFGPPFDHFGPLGICQAQGLYLGGGGGGFGGSAGELAHGAQHANFWFAISQQG